MDKPWYERGHWRMLVDMHIPDWDERFLSKFDPAEMVRLYKLAGLTSVMFYTQSHVGLCYWPTRTGKMHEGLRGRDIVGETLALLRKARIAACAYYSVIYNNWAYLEHPDWRMVAVTQKAGQHNGDRYGRCCPNNPGYRAFALAQTEELLGRYKFDGMFFDMTFWPRVCVCPHCRERFKKEDGADIPQTIDWCSPGWCAFQSARERWMLEFALALTDRAKRTSPGITVYHNFATALSNWVPLSFRVAEACDFLGADFYGDSIEQLMVSKFMTNLTENRPVEFMTSRCVSLVEHEKNKNAEVIRMQALATTLFGGAMLFIDAINPDGTVNPEPYRMIRGVYDEMSRYEPFLGGEAVEDVAIYFSGDSKMDFAESGRPISEAAWKRDYPHLRAVRGACRALQQAHIPFGIISRRQLGALGRYKVLILPNVLRMDAEEATAFRQYVRRGGRLYASRYTSLTETKGVRHEDFMLADLFGCHFGGDNLGNVAYIEPRATKLVKAVRPQRYVSVMALKDTPAEMSGALRLAHGVEGKVLATLTLPYAKEWGTVNDGGWSSIHSSPPWENTDTPVVTANRFGKGRAAYSAADIESLDGEADRRFFLELIHDLLGGRESASTDAHPCVWMSVTHQSDKGRFIVGFLNYQAQLPAIPIARFTFTLRPSRGERIVRLRSLPDGQPVRFSRDKAGVLRADVRNLKAIRMFSAEYR